jgi:hypothetical protein
MLLCFGEAAVNCRPRPAESKITAIGEMMKEERRMEKQI